MSKKNPKIENISPASSLGSNSPRNMKEKVLKTPEGMLQMVYQTICQKRFQEVESIN